MILDAFFVVILPERGVKMRYGLIGERLSHSFSKDIHERIADYQYDIIPLTKEEFHPFMQAKQFQAINVTIPYKKDVIPYLDELDESAQKIGAVNTIVNDHGFLKGYNTDYYGFDYMLQKHSVDLEGKKVIVLGNGGASAAIQAVVQSYPIKEMIVVNRRQCDNVITYEQCYKHHQDAHILINTTPVGMFPHNDASPIQLSSFMQLEAVIDIVYNPLYTQLCVAAKERKIAYVGGLEMLIAQAKYAVEHFLQTKLDDVLIDQIYRDMLKERINIALIGMPSCGKSTIAKILSEKLQRPLIEFDDEIVTKTKMSIPQIFELMQEEGFRKIESEICAQYAKQNGYIFSTGGGIIKNEKNMQYLQQNSIIVFIDRDIEKLVYEDDNRPLSKNKEAIIKMFQERYPLYKKYANIIVTNNISLEAVVDEIIIEYKNALDKM